MLRVRAPLLGLIALLLTGGGAAAAEDLHTPIPGTGVSLIVPTGFTLSSAFPGLGRDEDLSSVLVTELPFPLEIARRSLEPAALEERGLSVHRIGIVEVDGHAALLVHASQSAGGIQFRKWMVLIGDDQASVLITATTPLDKESVHQQALVEALRTARWSGGQSEANRAEPELPFVIREPAPLRVVASSRDALLLSDPSRTGEAGASPIVSVGVSRALVQIANLAEFANQRLNESVTVDQIEVRSEAPRKLAGLPAHEIRADAHDTATGDLVRITQVLATDGARYFLLQGVARRDEAERFAPLFEAVVESFSLREDSPSP